MSRPQFTRLIDEFCNLSWLHDADAVMAGGPIEADGNRFSLIYRESINPDALFIYCECGAPPLGRDIEAYRLLLKKNLFFYQGHNGPVFSMSPETGKILLVQYELLDSMTAQLLSQKLALLSAQAKSWRHELFEAEKEASRKIQAPYPGALASRLLLKTK